jgi:WD40 repeat protein
VRARRTERSFSGVTDIVDAVAISRNGEQVAAACANGQVLVWDVPSGKGPTRLSGHTGPLSCLVFAPDGKTLAGAADETVSVWNLARPGQRVALEGHAGAVLGIAFRADGRAIATASRDKTVKLWDRAGGKAQATLQGHSKEVLAVSFRPSPHQLVSYDKGGQLIQWDVPSARPRAKVSTEHRPAAAVFTPSGDVQVAIGHAANIQDWLELQWCDVNRAFPHECHLPEDFPAISFSRDGRTTAAVGHDGQVTVFETLTGKERLRIVRKHTTTGACFSPDGGTLAVYGGTSVQTWDLATGRLSRSFASSKFPIRRVRFSLNGKVLAAVGGSDEEVVDEVGMLSKPCEVMIWHLAGPDAPTVIAGLADFLWLSDRIPIALSPDGMSLATADARHVGIPLWRTANAKKSAELLHRENVSSLFFNPRGTVLAAAETGGRVKLWDLAAGRSTDLTGHKGQVLAMSFSPDGNTLATSSADGTLRLWDAVTGQERLTLQGKGIRSLQITSDGNGLVYATTEGVVRFWDVSPGKKVRRVMHTFRSVAAHL